MALGAQHCCTLYPIEQNRLQTFALRGLFSSTKSAVSLPSSQPRRWAAAPVPQTCATSSSRLAAQGDPRAPFCSTTAPSASCMTWSRAIAFTRPKGFFAFLLTDSILTLPVIIMSFVTLLLKLIFRGRQIAEVCGADVSLCACVFPGARAGGWEGSCRRFQRALTRRSWCVSLHVSARCSPYSQHLRRNVGAQGTHKRRLPNSGNHGLCDHRRLSCNCSPGRRKGYALPGAPVQGARCVKLHICSFAMGRHASCKPRLLQSYGRSFGLSFGVPVLTVNYFYRSLTSSIARRSAQSSAVERCCSPSW